MSNIGAIKLLMILFVVNIIENNTAPVLIKAFINIPITFLIFSFVIYKSKFNTNALYAFSFGLYVDVISDSPIGLNAALFLMMAYVVNSYSNTFKLFSYLQICIFFGACATAYVGFSQIILNLYNFSYLTLFLSAIFNIMFCIFVAFLSIYFPSISSRKI